jgi:hypothetical protein
MDDQMSAVYQVFDAHELENLISLREDADKRRMY